MSDDVLPLIGVIAKLELKPGDIVVLKSRAHLPSQVVDRIRTHFKSHLPFNNKVMILEGLDLEVLSPTEQPSDTARTAVTDS